MYRFKNILCVLEPEHLSPATLIRSIRLAETNQAKLTVISVTQQPKLLKRLTFGDEQRQHIENDFLQQNLQQLTQLVQQHTENVVDTKVLMGTPFIEIIRQVLRCRFDLVVKSPQPSDWLDKFLGSYDMHLLRKCPCPVLMLKPDANHTFNKLLATVDVEDAIEDEHGRVQQQLNQSVLTIAAALAVNQNAALHIASVWSSYGEDFLRHSAFTNMDAEKVDKVVADVKKELREKLDATVGNMHKEVTAENAPDVKPQVHFIKGNPCREIPRLTHDLHVDLVVMGTVARLGVQGFIIGNTAEQILEQVNCSVLAIKPTGFQSPVSL